MSKIPKWLQSKETLTCKDVLKAVEVAGSSLERIFAYDQSCEISSMYSFTCDFCPSLCQIHFHAFRRSEVVQKKMRSHIKDHAMELAVASDEVKDRFCTRNHLFKRTKRGAVHQKNKVQEQASQGDAHVKSDNPEVSKARTADFTKLKKSSEDQLVMEYADTTELNPLHHSVEPKLQGEKREPVCDEETYLDSDDKMTNEPHSSKCPREQETYQYKLATRMFALDRSFWDNVEAALEEQIEADEAQDAITQEEKKNILNATTQWIQSLWIFDEQTADKIGEPLTQEEEQTLSSMNKDDWDQLHSSQDPLAKRKLEGRAKLLLREYESFPRKSKPKMCKHCEKVYTASTSLHSHLVSLSGIRYWICSRCKDNDLHMSFTRKHSLLYHILKENDIPRYICLEPGCFRKHNHTHHQKSHARQHTGEKKFICQVEGCSDFFSNRNTYSRHLLQRHSIELTRNNEFKEIDALEASQKVEDARLKARERSKVKRQQSSDKRLSPCPPEMDDSSSKKRKTEVALVAVSGSNASAHDEQTSTAVHQTAENADVGAIGGSARASPRNYLEILCNVALNMDSRLPAPSGDPIQAVPKCVPSGHISSV